MVGTLLLNEMLQHEAFVNHDVADYAFLQVSSPGDKLWENLFINNSHRHGN